MKEAVSDKDEGFFFSQLVLGGGGHLIFGLILTSNTH